ncbi:Cys-tRNA(Pro) deacylase [Clostridium acidisoli DSM 12555]|uniref:Cys-tRNA(Pro) deacylase n=1 Tax=Clostridium acidisoli DSM 12555 TaxID=1121291 RepID=A0A1W1XFN0_9CLOT|nr:YbaK/EbsC family protein [Clostridium acidisoli]SMC22739.1 Cys-tRNA(Pro) deacylase [Clostridium acidisoli DSM 12555]
MSVENVRKFFLDRNLEDPVFTLDESGATVDLAAETIGVNPEFIAKTLAFNVKEKKVLVVTRGDARVDNKKFKQLFKTKARMINSEDVESSIGHPVGGVCPFGVKDDVEIFIDESIRDFEYVYPAAGSKNTALKISPSQIEELTNASWVDVCTY